MRLAAIQIGPSVLHCFVCETWDERTKGLQGYVGLPDDQGMWFPHADELASVHMASVSFPIDVLFIHGDRIAKIVSNIPPGTPGRWTLEHCDGVFEVRGGWCADHGVFFDTRVRIP